MSSGVRNLNLVVCSCQLGCDRTGEGGTNGGTQDYAEVSALNEDVLDTELLRPERGFDPADDRLSIQARLRG